MTAGASEGIRRRARRELTAQITAVARRQLAEVGAAALSVRAITRELEMAPSSVYRYFPNRDALLTALIVDAYESVAEAAEQAERAVPRGDVDGRWLAVFRGVRVWGLAHPHEFALIYGSPVPGYVAPEETAEPAARVALLLAGIAGESWLRDGVGSGAGGVRTPSDSPDPSSTRQADAEMLAGYLFAVRPDLELDVSRIGPERVMAVVDAWTELIGSVSFELFGHYRRVISDRAERLDAVARRCGRRVGLPI